MWQAAQLLAREGAKIPVHRQESENDRQKIERRICQKIPLQASLYISQQSQQCAEGAKAHFAGVLCSQWRGNAASYLQTRSIKKKFKIIKYK